MAILKEAKASPSMHNVEKALRHAVRERLGQDRYELWFGVGVHLSIPEPGSLRVSAADQFTLDRLRMRFRNDLASCYGELTGSLPQLDFQLAAPASPVPSASPESASSANDMIAISSSSQPSPSAPVRLVKLTQPPPQGASSRGPVGAPRAKPRLEEFVVGESNRLAFMAVQSVLRQPGAVSPFYLHGPTGCGKTHLLEGMQSTLRRSGLRQVICLSAEQFTSHFLEALQGGGLPNFRRKYRDLDALLIDDVQFFRNKRATLVEFQHTLDALLREGKQLIFSGDRSPRELPSLGAELTARLAGGLVCGLDPLDEQSRLEVLRRKAARFDQPVEDAALGWIASRMAGDARRLSGALHRLQAASEALRQPMTMELAEQALSDLIGAAQPVVRLKDIETAVCEVFGVTPDNLQSARKTKAVSQPRMLAMWLARKHTRAAYSEIGEYFGNRSHSTVISANKKVENWMSGNEEVVIAHASCPVKDAIRRVETQLQRSA